MGTVDLVVLVESPGSVSRGLQRIGRAGHQVGEPSTGKIFPKYRGDLLEAAIVVRRMRDGSSRRCATRATRSTCSRSRSSPHVRDRRVGRRRPARARAPLPPTSPSSPTTRSARRLDMLAGPLPVRRVRRAAAARRLGPRRRPRPRPRRRAARSRSRAAARSPTAACSACSCPTARASASSTRRWSTRAASARRSCSARPPGASRRSPFDRVVVTPAPGEPGKTPFWKGDQPGPAARARPRARRARPRAARRARSDAALDRLQQRRRRSTRARRRTCSTYLDEQAEATGAIPDDRTIVIERFRRRDRRLARLHPHAVRLARARAVGARDRGDARRALDLAGRRCCGATTASSAACPSRSTTSRSRCCSSIPTSVDELVVDALAEHVAVRVPVPRETRPGRCCCPAAGPGERTPLWQQRQRAGRPARGRGRLPDVPDPARDDARVPARRLRPAGAARGARPRCGRGAIRVVPVETRARLAVRADPAVRLDRGVHVRGRRAARRAPRRRARARPRPAARPPRRRGAARAARPGACSPSSSSSCSGSPEVAGRATPTTSTTCSRDLGASPPTSATCRADGGPVAAWLDPLVRERRAVTIGSRRGPARPTSPPRTRPASATRSAARSRPGCRARSPIRSTRPLDDLVARYARTHVPFTLGRRRAAGSASPASGRWGASRALGARRPGRARRVPARRRGAGVVRRRRAAAAAPPLARRLRHEVEPVDAEALARFLPRWHGSRRGSTARASPQHLRHAAAAAGASSAGDPDALVEAISQLQGRRLACRRSTRRAAARVAGYRPAMLDELCAAGELVWIGAGALGADDGRVRLFFRDQLAAPRPGLGRRSAPTARCTTRSARRSTSAARAFWPDLVAAAGTADDAVVLTALWDLVWAGEVTNDTFGPLRAMPRRWPEAGHAGQAAGAAAPGPADAPRPARGRGTLVARRPAARARRRRPPSARTRWRPAAARTPRRRHPRGRARRRHGRRLRRRVPRAARARGVGPGAARLVRRRARRRAVRAARRGRSPAFRPGGRDADRADERRGRRGHRGRRARRDRSGPAVRRGAAVARHRRPPVAVCRRGRDPGRRPPPRVVRHPQPPPRRVRRRLRRPSVGRGAGHDRAAGKPSPGRGPQARRRAGRRRPPVGRRAARRGLRRELSRPGRRALPRRTHPHGRRDGARVAEPRSRDSGRAPSLAGRDRARRRAGASPRWKGGESGRRRRGGRRAGGDGRSCRRRRRRPRLPGAARSASVSTSVGCTSRPARPPGTR